MSILKLSAVAQKYYNSMKGSNIVCGFVKHIVTDGENCLVVPEDYMPAKGEAVFRLAISNCSTICSLVKYNQ